MQLSTDASNEQPNSCSARNPEPDTCWSWVVCLAGAVSNMITCGIVVSYGVIFPTLLEEFQQGKAKTGKRESASFLVSNTSDNFSCTHPPSWVTAEHLWPLSVSGWAFAYPRATPGILKHTRF